ncbi:hypothetical protein [Afifella sp. IM 167]|uniref:hypothetical protein n=1 Tax=Afifella sp. IM 167 TaxID=2033586 RepID=UPI001CCBA6C4|nr:hypothetical protein [Afifella sp. IM 167]
MTHTFTSLRHPQEKLLEAEYFLGRLVKSNGLEFQFELNAFLSASRSVSFVLQKAMAGVADFAGWYSKQQTAMKADIAMRYFLELRNVSQKQGPVSFVGGSLPNGLWTYRFVGCAHDVPPELVGADIGASCATHLSKLGQLLLDCAQTFPFQSCPARAFTEEGMAVLGYDWGDVEAAMGLPKGYTQVGNFPARERLRILSREIEPLDISSIMRIASRDIRADGSPVVFPASSGTDLVDHIAANLGSSDSDESSHRDVFL